MFKPLQAHLPIQPHVLSFICMNPCMQVSLPTCLLFHQPCPLSYTKPCLHLHTHLLHGMHSISPFAFHPHTLIVPSPIPLAISSLPPHLPFTMNKPHPHLLLERLENTEKKKKKRTSRLFKRRIETPKSEGESAVHLSSRKEYQLAKDQGVFLWFSSYLF